LMPLLFESRRMSTMPKKIDDELKARAVRLVSDHLGEYSSLTAAAAVVAKQLGVGKESVRRWVIQSQVDGGQRGLPRLWLTPMVGGSQAASAAE